MLAPARELVFLSYSHANMNWRDRLMVFLKPFERNGQLKVWADRYIRAGDVWRREIDAALARTRVGVVLLTPSLLASDFIARVEIPSLLRAARANHLTLIVVPIERHAQGSTSFVDGDLTDYQWPWSPSEPIDELDHSRRNRALVTVTNAIVQTTGPYAPPSPSFSRVVSRATEVATAAPLRVGAVHGVPSLPPNYLAQGEALAMLKRAVLGRSAVIGVSAGPSAVGLHGRGGIGKTVLAQGLVSDEEVRCAFPDGIYWISVGQKPRLASLLEELAEHFGTRPSVEDVPAGTRLLRERLREKACLLVLDDVWDLLHAKTFDVLDVHSRLLVTTRDNSLLTALGAEGVPLDSPSPSAALELMARWAGVHASQLPVTAKDVAKEVDYLPLGLSLAGAQIRDGRRWDDLLAALREGSLVYLDHPYGSVLKSIQTSVEVLPAKEAARYIELAVFPADVDIPVAMVEHLWHATGGLDARETRALLTRLAARNLLSITAAAPRTGAPAGAAGLHPIQEPSESLTLHDLHYDFTRLAVENLPTLHRRLVDAVRLTLTSEPVVSSDAPDQWARLPATPDYPWQFLAHHLSEAGRDEELTRLLTDPDWLHARLTRFSLRALLADYRHSLADGGLRSIRDALVLSGHVLAKESAALTGQLAGRLLPSDDSRVHRLTDRLPSELRGRPSFRPRRQCLTPPGGPLQQTFEGHDDAVTAVTSLPDGQRALSGSADGALKLWDLASGAVLQAFAGHARSVTAVTLLADGQRALSSGADGTLKLWDLASGAMLWASEAQTDAITALTLLPDGRRALSGSYESTRKPGARHEPRSGLEPRGTLKVWDLESGEVLLSTASNDSERITTVAVMPVGERVLFGSYDGTLKLWDVASNQVRLTFKAEEDVVTAMVPLPDGHRALLGTDNGMLNVCDIETGTVLETFEGHTRSVSALALLPDGRHALSGSRDKTLKLWDLASGVVLKTLEGHNGAISTVAALPDGRRALSGSADRTVKLWDLASGATLQTSEAHAERVTAVTLSSGGNVALSGSQDGVVKLWNLSSGDLRQTLKSYSRAITALALLPDAQRALCGSDDGALKLWDLGSGEVLQTFAGHVGGVTAAMLLPDSRQVLSGGSDGTLRLWELGSGVMLRVLEGHTDWVIALSVLPDGRRALSGSKDRTLRLWDLESGELLRTFEGHRSAITGVILLPGGERAISASADRTLKAWNLTSGVGLQTFEGHTGRVSAVAISSDGKHAVSASSDRTLKVWDLASACTVRTLEGHTGAIEAMVLLEDGRRVLSAGEDRMLKLWDLASGEVLATFYGEAPFTSAALSGPVPCVVAGDSLGRIHILGIENLV